jgi:hypothetical protein
MPHGEPIVQNGHAEAPSLFFTPWRCRWFPWLTPFIAEPVLLQGEIDSKSKDHFPLAAIALCGISIVGLASQVIAATSISHRWLAAATVPAAAWGLAALVLALARPRTGSLALAPVYFCLLATHLAVLMATWSGRSLDLASLTTLLGALLSVLACTLVLRMPLRDPIYRTDGISPPFTNPTKELRSPEDNLTLWQWMTVSWIAPMIRIGTQRQLNDDDVWTLSYEFQHTYLHLAFRELKGGVVRRLLKANWIDIVLLSLLAILEMVANYCAPLLLQQLLRAMENLRYEKRPAIIFAGLILAVRLIAAQSAVFSLWFGRRCYERSRGVCSS